MTTERLWSHISTKLSKPNLLLMMLGIGIESGNMYSRKRAQVVKILGSDEFKVVYIDYGNVSGFFVCDWFIVWNHTFFSNQKTSWGIQEASTSSSGGSFGLLEDTSNWRRVWKRSRRILEGLGVGKWIVQFYI
jgi:hypothetical protein